VPAIKFAVEALGIRPCFFILINLSSDDFPQKHRNFEFNDKTYAVSGFSFLETNAIGQGALFMLKIYATICVY